MFTNFFKSSKTDEQTTMAQRQAELAMQDRMNRMMRQSMQVEWAPPPTYIPMAQTRSVFRTLR